MIVACDVGGTRLRVALVDPDGSVRDRETMPTPRDEPAALGRHMRRLLDGASEPVEGAVVGIAGFIDYSAGTTLKLPNLPGWDGGVSTEGLREELGLPVLLANDADLAALGEHRYGAGVGVRDMLYLTCSTGVGSGVILGGRLVRGDWSLAEIGHTIIDGATSATLESRGSGTALTRLTGEDAAVVVARAKEGDPKALADLAAVADAFSIGVYNLVHCFGPELVVVGGGMSSADDLLLDPARARLALCGAVCPASRTRVTLAAGGDEVGLRGAAALWADAQAG